MSSLFSRRDPSLLIVVGIVGWEIDTNIRGSLPREKVMLGDELNRVMKGQLLGCN